MLIDPLIESADSAEDVYISKLFASQDSIFNKLSDLVACKRDFAPQLDYISARILGMIIKLHNAKRVVELGTLFGYSAMWIANSLPIDGALYTIDKNSESMRIAQKLIQSFNAQNKVNMICGNALEELDKLNGVFDLIFIDADKMNYCNYLDWAEKNIKKNGVIVSDNTLFFGNIRIADDSDACCGAWRVVREFNARLADDSKYFSVMLPIAKGIMVSVKKF